MAQPKPRPKLVSAALRHRRRGQARTLSQQKDAVNNRRQRFTQEYIALLAQGKNKTEAMRAAAIAVGYSPKSADVAGARLVNRPEIRAITEKAIAKRQTALEVNGEAVMRYWRDIATSELPLPPVGACRYCWGFDHQYQYTQDECRRALRKHTADQLKRQPHERVPFDDLGGEGFDRTKKPHPYCPECHGVGKNYPMVIDAEKLTPGQRASIDAITIQKDGSVTLKMRDRSRAMENLQSLMGMIQPRKPLEVLDPNAPIEENVNILLQTAIDQGLVTLGRPATVIEHDGATEQLADAAAD